MRSQDIIRVLIITAVILALGCSLLSAQDEAAPPKPKYPVLLIHGLASDASSWKLLPFYLSNRGFKVYVMDFSYWEWLDFGKKNDVGFNELAAVLSRQMSLIRRETGADKVNIIAHSIAGIMVRAYAAGWGRKAASWGGYGDDIAGVIYLGTPHFGLDSKGNKLRLLLKETDYGKFLNASNIITALSYGSSELVELQEYFRTKWDKLGIEEVTISSQSDHVVKEYCTNLDGLWLNPLAPAAMQDSRHVHLKNYQHAYCDLLGRPARTLIGVFSKNHPVYNIAYSFFSGTNSWTKYRTEFRRSGTIAILSFIKGAGFDPKTLNLGNTILKKVKTPKRSKKVRLERNARSGVFYAIGLKSGTYELMMPFKGDPDKTFRFEVEIAGNSGTIINFDPNNPPLEPGRGGGGGGVDKPEEPDDVYDYNTLVQFVKARFPKKCEEYMSGTEINGLVGNVRNTMANTYSNIGQPLYSSDNDKFRLKSQEKTIDFAEGSSSPGVLLNKLQWVEVDDEPPDDGGGGGGSIGEKPTMVYDKASLVQFCLWLVGDRYYQTQYPNLRTLAREIINALEANYPGEIMDMNEACALHYGKPCTNSHSDTFWLIKKDQIIDFCLGTDTPAALSERIWWSVGYWW
jgi:pimeloyl-ACP methyl ester carboxylesterase